MLHTLVNALEEAPDHEFKTALMSAILAIAKQLGHRYSGFAGLFVGESVR